MSEELLQQVIVEQFRHFYKNLIIVSSMNGVNLSQLKPTQRAIIVKNMKLQGFVKGFSDLEVILPKGKVLYVELKRPDGKGVQSQDQKNVESKLKTLGHSYFLINSIEGFFKVVNDHLDLEYRLSLLEAYKGDFNTKQLKEQYSIKD